MSDKYNVRHIDLDKLSNHVREQGCCSEEAALHLMDTVRVLNENIDTLTAGFKEVQAIAKSALDRLPERWSAGFQSGLKQAAPYEKALTEALERERKARADDNAGFTADIMLLEAEIDRLNNEEVEKRQLLMSMARKDGWEQGLRGGAKAIVERAESEQNTDTDYGNGKCAAYRDIACEIDREIAG